MIVSSGTKKPKIHSSAYVAPTATVAGDVTIGSGCAILHGAVISAEGAPIAIGTDTVIMELAVVKSSGGSAVQFPVSIGSRCIVGPHAFVVGATIGDACHLAHGASVYNGVTVAPKTRLAPHAILAAAEPFHETVFNVPNDGEAHAKAATAYAQFLRKTHAQDAIVGDGTHTTKAVPRRSGGEEPPQQQMTQVEGVVDAMMLELQEMEFRRQESLKKHKRTP